MPKPATITVDGPASSGKSTLGERLARELGYVYFDTGVMYRALTLAAHQHAIEPESEAQLEALARQITIEVREPTHPDGRQYTVLVDGHDVTWDLRQAAVDRDVSLVSRYPGVRAELIRQQRQIGERGNVVMVGRDIGSVVMPDAPLKVYLTASLEERARRRAEEQRAHNQDVQLEQVAQALTRRDTQDEHVMQPAPDAVEISTDTLSPAEVVAAIMALVQAYEQRTEAAPSVSTTEEARQ